MKKQLVILPDQYRRRSAIVFLTLTAVLVLLFWESGISGSGALAAFFFVGMIGLGGSVSFETRIFPGEREKQVTRVWYLGGIVPVGKRSYPAVAFRGVQPRFLPEAQHDTWQVGLVTDRGRFLMVTYFSSRTLKHPYEETARFRDYLAHLLEVPVLGEEQAA